ncbi:MAG: T9SS type A sorting domain-containing protein [Chitinophagales bacterium]
MKYFYSLVFALILTTTLFAQTLEKKWPVLPNSPNYFEVRTEYLNYLNELDIEAGLFDIDNEADDLRAKFMRWDYLMRTRVDPDGNYPDPRILFLEFDKYKINHTNINAGNRAATWEPVGTAVAPENGGGVGRVNCLIFDPVDHNILYAGTAGGGLWKSPDAGATWIPISDNIPVTSIADVAVDPTNNNIIYLASGDGYGYEADWQPDQDFWGGVYSAGILKSTDGGVTWLPTGLSYLQEELSIIQRLIIHPDNPNVLITATRNGIYRTDDGGDTWTLVETKHCYDFAFNKSDADIIYAVGDKDVLRSTNAGLTWEILENNLSASDDRMSIETTADDPDVIYVFCPGDDMFISEDAGNNWSNLSSPGSVTTFYGYYDRVLGVSDVDKDLVFTGGLEIARTTNGGNTWSKKSDWDDWGDPDYVHADNKVLLCDPLDENIVYSGNDGGIFKSTDKGQTWTDISDGLRIAQPYRISCSYTVPEMVLSGWQDNGTNLWDGTGWTRVLGGDGMEAIIDYTNEDRIYAEYYNGYLNRSTNGGDTWEYCPTDGGAWLTPYVMDPIDHLTMYFGTGTGGIQKSTNGGTSWINKPATLGGEVFAIAVAPSNTNYIYAAALETIKVSTDAGDSWTNITGALPHTGIGFNYIAVSDENPEHVWVVLSGYDDGNKVFYSDDAGDSWTNISGTLPNVPVNCIVYENVSMTNRIYIGTDLGVFTKDDLTADWEPYMTGLPNVMVHELEISYANYKLYAATYGRNIWRSDLFDYVVPTLAIEVAETQYCPAEELNVSFTATGAFYAGNVFSAELSSATGSFGIPTVIGSVTSTDLSGIIACTIPADAESGTEYRMRVVSSLPDFNGTANPLDITITCGVPSGLNEITVTGSTANLEWDDAVCAVAYEVEYKPAASPDWLFASSTTPSITLTGLIPNTLYDWAVKTICVEIPEIETAYSTEDNFTTGQNSIEEIAGISDLSIYPNPFSTSTGIQFILSEPAEIKIELIDVTGRLVLTINDSKLNSGYYSFDLEKDNLSNGVYTIQFTSGDKTMGKPVVID